MMADDRRTRQVQNEISRNHSTYCYALKTVSTLLEHLRTNNLSSNNNNLTEKEALEPHHSINNPCEGVENVSIIVHTKKRNKYKTRKKYKFDKHNPRQEMLCASRSFHAGIKKYSKIFTRHHSFPDLNNNTLSKNDTLNLFSKSFHTYENNNQNDFHSKFIVNIVSEYPDSKAEYVEYRVPACLNPFNNPLAQARWRIYRCQLNTQEESCCCSCNSDAMFEVMKSLYDCYKKKNCDHCNCILCGHLPREERRLGEMRKSAAGLTTVGVETASGKERKKEKLKKAKEEGLLTPLEGKTPAEKEKIIRGLAKAGLPLPEGKTKSEKSLIKKIKAETEKARKSKASSAIRVPSEKLRKAKEAGVLTPLEGKTPEQKEKILRGMAMHGVPLPEGKTPSEKKLIDKVRTDMGLPPEPKTPSAKDKYKKAVAAGFITPLEGKSPSQKEKILQGQADLGLPLPEGRTPSEKALIAKVKAAAKAPSEVKVPSEKLRKAKAAGVLTPLEGKTPEQKEKILKGMAMHGIPLPEGKTPSEKKLIDKVRADLSLPPEPKTPSIKEKHKKAMAAGLLTPLEGKSPSQKEKILQGQADLGLPLPEGRTPSEKALIAKVKAATKAPSEVKVPSEKLRKAKAAGVLTPLEGKTPEQKEKILKGMAMHGIPLPEGKTPSEKKIIDKVRADLGLPPEPKTPSAKDKYKKAMAAGFITPLEGKSPSQKEKILQGQADLGLPLPEGRTPSEKALIAKVKAAAKAPSEVKVPSEKLRKAKAAGVLTPLEGKTPEQKEKILKGMAMHGIPLPEGKTPSEKKLIDKVRADLGLPPEPKTPSIKEKHKKAMAAGLLTPLEGKSPSQKEKILQGQADLGLPLPEGRTPSEKALIAKVKAAAKAPSRVKVPSEKLRKAKAAGVLTPLEGKTPEQKEKILKGMAMHGIPLPEGKTPSEKKIIDKVRADLGLPPEPKTPSAKDKYKNAMAAGLITPLEGKSPSQKERILQGQADMGLPLPEGRTPSEKALIAKVKASARPPSEGITPSEKLRKAKAAGLLTPLEGKSPEQREKILRGLAKHGLPLPEPKTASEKKLMDKIRSDVEKERKETRARAAVVGPPALPLEQRKKLDEKTAKVMKEGKGPSDECICGLLTPESERVSKVSKVSPGRIPSEKIRAAKAAGLLTPLENKPKDQKEKILRGLIKQGLPLPEAKTPSEKELMDRVRAEAGLPPEPRTPSSKEKYAKAQAAGLITPLDGKTPSQKEKILKGLAEIGVPLPDGRTPSEKALVNKIRAVAGAAKIPSEKLRKAKAAGLLTPLEGKTQSQKEKILKGRVAAGLPLPEGKTPSEKELIKKIKDETGYVSPAEKIASEKEMLRKATAAGLIPSLEGKTPSEKAKIIKSRIAAGLPLPEPKSASDKELIKKLQAEIKPFEAKVPSEKMRQAKAAGLLTPLEGKTPEQKEKILKGLAKAGLPLPEGKTQSEKDLIRKVRAVTGLPPEPKTPSQKIKYQKALAAGIVTPLEGKTPAEKEKILKKLHDAGIPLPEGRTPSEKSMVRRVKAGLVAPSEGKIPSEKMKAAKAAGLLTPLEGKTPAQKEKILKGLAKSGIPLPEGKTPSEKELIKKVRTDMGLPPEPKTPSLREKMRKAQTAGIITPLEGKTPSQKEKKLKGMAQAGIPLPEGRTPSEKALIEKARTEAGLPSAKAISEKALRKAKEEGLLTPLTGKSPSQKKKILKGLAEAGLPMPEGNTASEKSLIRKVRVAAGLPPEPTPSEQRRVKTKSKRVGISPSKKSAKLVSTKKKTVAGITEKIEEIAKTTKCDRACGCDRKKIKFKHSYVKIRVTSPDISSFCPCPDECIPGVKNGVFTDSEGIKVTVGRAVGVPSYSRESTYDNINSHSSDSYLSCFDSTTADSEYTTDERNFLVNTMYDIYNSTYDNGHNEIRRISKNKSSSKENFERYYEKYYTLPDDGGDDDDIESESIVEDHHTVYSTYKCHDTLSDDSYNSYTSIESFASKTPSLPSLESVLIFKTDSESLSTFSDGYENLDTISVISIDADSLVSSHDKNFYSDQFNNEKSDDNVVDSEYFIEEIDYIAMNASFSNDKLLFDNKKHFSVERNGFKFNSSTKLNTKNSILIFRTSKSKMGLNSKKIMKVDTSYQLNESESIVIINDLDSDHNVMNIVKEILSKKSLSDASSVVIVIQSSDSSVGVNSTICIRLSDNCKWNENSETIPQKRTSSLVQGLKISTKGRKYFMEGLPVHNFRDTCQDVSVGTESCNKRGEKFNFAKTDENLYINIKEKHHEISTDTTQDRPCCCLPRVPHFASTSKVDFNNQFDINVASEVIAPMMKIQGIEQGLSCEAYSNVREGNFTHLNQIDDSRPIKQTPVRLCKVPPCRQGGRCHPGDHSISDLKTSECGTNITHVDSKPYDVCPDKLKSLMDKVNKQLTSTGCGRDTKIAPEEPISKDDTCKTCGRPKLQGKLTCVCSGKKKRVMLKTLCPCEEHKPPEGEKRSVDDQSCTSENAGTETDRKTCVCKNKASQSKKNKRKAMCECPPLPPEPEEPIFIPEVEWVDEKEARKMKSDLTQTTSGFKVDVKKRPKIEEEMSFEDALKYFAEHPEEDETDHRGERGENCTCEETDQNIRGRVECECPYEPPPPPPLPPPPEPEPEEPLKGFKLVVEGKGSGSKGLSGVCCFDLLQDQNERIPKMLYLTNL